MNNPIKNLRIRHKLYLISFISIVSILTIGYMANYFVRTSNVVAIILKGHRIHNVNFHASVRDFYKYLITHDTLDLINSRAKMEYAENLAKAFSNVNTKPYQVSHKAFVQSLHESFAEAFNDDYPMVELTADRIIFLLSIDNQELHDAARTAHQVYEGQLQVKAAMNRLLQDQNQNNLQQLSNAIAVVTGYEKSFAESINAINVYVEHLLYIGIVVIVFIMGLITLLVSLFISATISRPLRSIMSNFEELAKGDLSQEINIQSKDEIGRLAQAINGTLEVLRGITTHARQIASGNYSRLLTPRSEKDELSLSLNEMTEALKSSSEAIKRDTWLKNGIAGLNDLLRGDRTLQEITSLTISYYADHLKMQMGMIYLMQDDMLHLSSSFAYSPRYGDFSKIKPGEGLIGQSVVERKMIEFSGIRDNAPILNSGLYQEIPNHMLICPLIFNKEVVGVVVLAAMDKFSLEEKEFATQTSVILSSTIFSAQSRYRIEKLLEQTQNQAEKLQVQQEELRQSNEELETQTQALKASEETLQAQQEELRVTNEELEEKTRVLEKERDTISKKNNELQLMQEEVTRKARDLEIASKYKSEFLANMSHELRTPLNSILVLSQLLTENKGNTLTQKQIEFARTINSSGADLLSLINDILDLSKVESGKIDLIVESIEIADFFNSLQSVFGPLAKKKEIDLNFIQNPEAPLHIDSDSKRLGQILKNLLSNAIKFTDKGSVVCAFDKLPPHVKPTRKELQGKQLYCFKVEDTGIGIATEKQKLIFEAFQQVDGTTSRKYGGTGLGLTISRSFADIIGGEIQLQSEPGKGSCFYLILEKKIEETARNTEIDHVSSTPQNNQPEKLSPGHSNTSPETEIKATDNQIPKQKSLLVIEDDLNFSTVLSTLATEKGFHCRVAADGETGLHYADFYKPDAIILDIGLPGIDGYEVMKRLKENPQTQSIPVHFMSASDNELDAMKLGAIGFLAKPVSLEKLSQSFKRIEEIIARKVKRLLIVEDDEAMRRSIRELTSDDGIEINEVADGKEALEYLVTTTVDCIILDLGLKTMSGFELLEKIRTNESLRQIPVIIYTGKDLSRTEEEQLKRYADSIIIKGVRSPERLVAETSLFLHQLSGKKVDLQTWKETEPLTKREAVLKGKKILIVDDDMRNVFALSSVLEDHGMIVMAGKNGQDGLDKLRKEPAIDLVLMDIMMPEMDGYEAMRHIRNDVNLKKLPVIALTAKAMKDDREKCIAAGANDYLVKPVDTTKLLSLLRVWLYK